jgi:hypothetical protein
MFLHAHDISRIERHGFLDPRLTELQLSARFLVAPPQYSLSLLLPRYHNASSLTPILTAHQEDNEISGSRGTAHFVWRCKNCKREHSASIKDGGPYAYDAEKGGRQKVIEIDNRGLEIVEFKPDVSPAFPTWSCMCFEGTREEGYSVGRSRDSAV